MESKLIDMTTTVCYEVRFSEDEIRESGFNAYDISLDSVVPLFYHDAVVGVIESFEEMSNDTINVKCLFWLRLIKKIPEGIGLSFVKNNDDEIVISDGFVSI